jgi:hypothetical protein
LGRQCRLQLKVASPCPASSDDMEGELNVYNLSDMTEEAALKLVEEREGVVAVGGLEPPPFLED